MKILKPYNAFKSISFYGLIIMNITLCILNLPSLTYTVGAFIVGNLVMYNAVVNDHYMFEYDNEKLIVKNTWNPFFYQGYWIKSLKRIEFDYFNQAGHGIRIFFDNKKDVYICHCNREDLKNMSEEINSYIKQAGM
jgi:hypothetical protein